MSKLSFVILAGGSGTRMDSDIPKPLRNIGGASMLERVIQSGKNLNPEVIVTVVRDERVKTAAESAGSRSAWQEKALGTADALRNALPYCEKEGCLIVTCADIPLVTEDEFRKLYSSHVRESNYITLLTAQAEDPYGYGRVVKEGGKVVKIVEEKEASAEEKKIGLINSGIYCIERNGLEKYISRIRKSPVKGEYYLTDLVEIVVGDGLTAGEERCGWEKIQGVNTEKHLAKAEKFFKKRG